VESDEILAQLDELDNGTISRRDLLRRTLIGGVGLASLGPLAALLAEDAEAAGPSLGLINKAKGEGQLNTIALPPDWANYGEILQKFQARYHIPITNANPVGSSAQENQALVSLRGQRRAPDVVDVSPSFAAAGKAAGLYIPFKVSTWKTIPKNMKDAGGAWTGDYWGVQSFITNLNVVKQAPNEWADLSSPTLKGKVAIDGDPRTAGDAFGAVYAAALAHGGSLDNIEPGIEYFAKLKKLGNFIPAQALTANIAKGATPVAIKWDYLNLAVKQEFRNNPSTKVTIPSTGVYGSYYCQALAKAAPHPNAAKLWLEYLYSDEGQLLFLKGFTHPARYLDLVARNKVPAKLANQLPPAKYYKNVRFASLTQIANAAKVVAAQWGPKVAGK
jgi:putative spermidine/putrescine transport system substrate-binding protein